MSESSSVTVVLLTFVPVLVVLLGGAGWWIRHERERREAIESQLSEKKYAAYTALIDIFFDTLKASKSGNLPPDAGGMKIMDANKALLVFGSDEVFLSFQDMAHSGSAGTKVMLHKFGEVILAIRRDMGNPKTKLSSDNVLRSFITDFDEMRQKGLL